MIQYVTSIVSVFLFISLIAVGGVSGRDAVTQQDFALTATSFDANPAYCLAVHDVGLLRLVVQNNGTLGLYRNTFGLDFRDCFTGDRISQGCEYPTWTGIEHLFFSSLWVGAVVGDDTLVSTGQDGWRDAREFHPDEAPIGNMLFRSTIDEEAPEFEGAVSEQDFIAVYTDTFKGTSRDYFAARPHMPLRIEVTQKSYAWSYTYAEDIVLVDYEIKNIGFSELKDVYLGLYVDADIGFNFGFPFDDFSGFMQTYPMQTECGVFEDTLNVAWSADNDGDPINGSFVVYLSLNHASASIVPRKSAPFAYGTRLLRTPNEEANFSFNWWSSSSNTLYDIGPRHKANVRDYRTGGLGTPEGDLNKYAMMRNGEIDYDQPFFAEIDENDPNWLKPSFAPSWRISRGSNTRYLQSAGPFHIQTGETVPLTVAYFVGKGFHNIAGNGGLLYYHVDRYHDNLDFSGLADNARWASWLFDNPGVDTDDDGYFGKFIVCLQDSDFIDSQWVITQSETTYYTGDGVPDFRGAAPPPAPPFWVTPLVNGLHVRFNGQKSERTKDFLTHKIDFEGFNVYLGRDDRPGSFSMIASYDRENYDKFFWRFNQFVVYDLPYSRDSLICLYGESCSDSVFDPRTYSIATPFRHPLFLDSIFYFAPHGANSFRWGKDSPIRKIYPDAEPVSFSTDIDTLPEEYFTEEGYLKFYEYEFEIENLLPTIPYYVSVTAFDMGSPKSDLVSLETSVTNMAQMMYPYSSEDQAVGEDLKVYIYPNPYRIDGEYRSKGFEGRADFRPDYRVRAIHFENLPTQCTISIYSIDGDLIRSMDHDEPSDNRNSRHHVWDMITRNTQEISSGLYYWVVESADGKIQMGKLAVIL